jgi:hypothetical protein
MAKRKGDDSLDEDEKDGENLSKEKNPSEEKKEGKLILVKSIHKNVDIMVCGTLVTFDSEGQANVEKHIAEYLKGVPGYNL